MDIISFFFQYWGLNSGPHSGRQVLYHLSHVPSPVFALGMFQVGSLFFAQADLRLLSSYLWSPA
jgi:hypothetical protein